MQSGDRAGQGFQPVKQLSAAFSSTWGGGGIWSGDRYTKEELFFSLVFVVGLLIEDYWYKLRSFSCP